MSESTACSNIISISKDLAALSSNARNPRIDGEHSPNVVCMMNTPY